MVEIRHAVLEDGPYFTLMWRALIESLVSRGAPDIRWGLRTQEWYATIFRSAVENPDRGVVLAAEDRGQFGTTLAGGLMAHEAPIPWDHSMGRVAQGYGTWVDPQYQTQGIAAALYEVARKTLHERGFQSYLGAYHLFNEGGRGLLHRMGAEDVQVATHIRLA